MKRWGREDHYPDVRVCPLSASSESAKSAAPISFVHLTGDGPVHLLVKPSKKGWDSIHWSSREAGAWTFSTMAEANESVLSRFRDLYSGHRCSGDCRPVEAIALHKSEDLWGLIRE